MKRKKVGNARIYHENNIVSFVVLIDNNVEIARVTRAFSRTGGVMLGIPCRSNGMGASNSPVITSILQKLPCADDFYQASCFHDILYALGGVVTDRKTADKVWYEVNKIEVVSIKPWYSKFHFIRYNWYGYRLIRSGGDSSWGVTNESDPSN